MTSYKTPSRNCPASCPQNCGSSILASAFTNGQVPINLSKQKQQQGPRRFSARDWSLDFQGFYKPANFNQHSRHSWIGGPEDAVKPNMASEFGSISEIAESGIGMLKKQWISSCAEVGAAVKYLRHLWLTTNGNCSQKAMVVNRMVSFYLIILGIYIAEACFWVNQQLLDGLRIVLLKPKRNVDMLIGLAAVVVLLFLLYLVGGPASSSAGICTVSK